VLDSKDLANPPEKTPAIPPTDYDDQENIPVEENPIDSVASAIEETKAAYDDI